MFWYLFLIFLLLLLSIIAGQSSAPSTTTGGKDCTSCKEDFAWYSGLSRLKKVSYSGWWAVRKIACAANGC
jgi:hypothetical protein